MKILLINYRFFLTGGPERYMFNVISLLESKGHEVIPFSVLHKKNKSCRYEEFFLSPIGRGDEVFFTDYSFKNPFDILKIFGRMFYSFEAKRKLSKLIKKTKPDVIYCLQYQSKISCSVISAARKYGIPFVQRISDYAQICPNRYYYNQRKNQICEKCEGTHFYRAVREKCLYGSSFFSAVKAAATYFQQWYGIKKKIDAFAFTSPFTRKKFIEAGYDEKKTFWLPTFYNEKLSDFDVNVKYNHYALYVGRLDQDKGIENLIKAFVKTGRPLKLIGFSTTPNYEDYLKSLVPEESRQIEFLGKMEFAQIRQHLADCLFTVIPSDWYDNLPNTILESFAFKKCVVTTAVGSLKAAVQDGHSGFLFKYRDVDDLAKKTEELFLHPEKAVEMGMNAYELSKTLYSSEEHYERLMGIFKKVIDRTKAVKDGAV